MSVQSAHNSTASSVGSLAATFGVAVSNNGLVRGFVSWDSSDLTFLTTVTDDKGNSYTIVDKIADAAQGRAAASFYKEGITNGPTVITATLDAVNFKTAAMTLCVAEESGIATASAIDGHAGQQQTNPGTGTDAISSGNATTTANGDLVCSCVVSGTVTGVVHGTSFTDRESDTAVTTKIKCEDLVKPASGTIPGTWTDAANGASDSYITLVIAFKAAVTTAANVAGSRVFRGGRGPGAGPAMRRMAPQQFPTPGPTDAIIPGPQIQPLRSRGPGMGPRLRRMVPQRLQDAGATTTTLLPTEGAITIAGVAASLTLTIAAVAGAITIAGNAPSVTTVLQGVQGSVVIAGNTASTTSILAPVVGAVVISGSATALTQTLVGVTGAVTIGGSAPSLTGILVATEGAVVIGGNVPSIIVSSGLTPSEGAITLAGNAPDLLAALSVSEGAISIVGNSPDIPNISISPIDGASNFSLSKWRKWHRPEDERELRKLRLTPAVAEIIVEVAERQAAQLDLDEQQRLEELTRKLELKGLQWQGRYLELLNAQRQQLIDEEIGRLMQHKQAELQRRDEEAILLLLTII